MLFNEVGGQVEANLNTATIPAEDYEIDLEISNDTDTFSSLKIGLL